MAESVLTTAVEMASRSVSRVGDFLNTFSSAKDDQSPNTSASNIHDAFRSRFSLLGQSLNEKGQRLTEGFNKAFSGNNSPRNVLRRFFASPVPMRRTKSDRRRIPAQQKMRDYYRGQSRCVSSSPSMPWKSSQNESCSNRQQMAITGTDQLKECATDHSTRLELTTAEMERYGTFEQKCDIDLTAKQDNICGEIRDMNSMRVRSTNDVAAATETDFDGAEVSQNRIRKCVGRSCFMHRQQSNEENVRKESPSEYVRQDSGFHSEGENDTHSHRVNGRHNIAFPNKDPGVDADNVENYNNINPFQMISQILTAEQNEKRDLYRITHRPSRKHMRQRHSVCRSLNLRDRLLLNQFEKDLQTNDSNNNEEPKLKLSVQTFASSRQMRVIATEITNVDKLSLQSSKTEKHIQVCLKIGEKHHKINREVKSFDAGNLWEVFHFFDIDVEEMSNAELLIRLRCKQRYVFF